MMFAEIVVKNAGYRLGMSLEQINATSVGLAFRYMPLMNIVQSVNK